MTIPALASTLALVSTLALATFTPAPLDAQEQATPRLMNVRDTQNLATVGSAAISPDGQWVLHTRAERDWD